MIIQEDKYLRWIQLQGVGDHDQVASSTKSYISYLNTVSKLIDEDISSDNLYDESCIEVIEKRIKGLRSVKSISNYKSALRQYVNMVKAGF